MKSLGSMLNCAFIVRLLCVYCPFIVRYSQRDFRYQDTRIPGNRVTGVEVVEVGCEEAEKWE